MISRSLRKLGFAALAAAALAGCSESAIPQATGKGKIRGINAIATAPDVNFLIEERFIAGVSYKASSAFSPFDDLSYNFNFDYTPPAALNATRIATQFIDVQADVEYTVVLTGSIADPSTIVFEEPVREWTESETVFEVLFAHLGSQLGGLDLYMAAPGTVPVPGQAVGSLAFGERLPIREFAEDAAGYEFILTAKDDPSSVVYQSIVFGPAARSRITLGIFDPDPTLRGNIGVNLINESGASTRLADVNFPSQARTLHAALGTASFDGYLDGNFANLVFSDIAYRELSQYADVANAQSLLTLTPVGNSGATIHEGHFTVSPAARSTVVLVGRPGGVSYIPLADSGRPLETQPSLRILNAALNIELLDVYVLDPGKPIDEAIVPRFPALPPLISTGFQGAVAGTRELTVTLRGEKTAIAAPVVLDLANGDRVDMVIVDTVDPAVVELVVFDFQPAP